jgi:HAD superfamily hydrolase (TIGR01450 family)
VTRERSTVVVDLDGVVWLAGEPLRGAGEGVRLLRAAGFAVIFATNNSSPTIAALVARLERAGIKAAPESIVTSAQAAALAVEPGTTAMVIGEEGLVEATKARGLVADAKPASVLVGWQRQFDFSTVADAATAVRDGALLVATNDDPTHPTPEGLLPGTGALVAAIATASEQPPLIAGKPGALMAALVEARATGIALVIGDRPSTDGAFARRLGSPFGLVQSEATPEDTGRVDVTGASLLEVVTAFVG